MVNKSPVISNCNILIWLVCHKISFVKEKSIYFSFRILDKFLYLSTCIVLRIKEINLKIDSTCIKMHMTILHVITCRFSYILNDIIYNYYIDSWKVLVYRYIFPVRKRCCKNGVHTIYVQNFLKSYKRYFKMCQR